MKRADLQDKLKTYRLQGSKSKKAIEVLKQRKRQIEEEAKQQRKARV